jgi:hypothetical protein
VRSILAVAIGLTLALCATAPAAAPRTSIAPTVDLWGFNLARSSTTAQIGLPAWTPGTVGVYAMYTGVPNGALDQRSPEVTDPNSDWLMLTGLRPETTYTYRLARRTANGVVVAGFSVQQVTTAQRGSPGLLAAPGVARASNGDHVCVPGQWDDDASPVFVRVDAFSAAAGAPGIARCVETVGTSMAVSPSVVLDGTTLIAEPPQMPGGPLLFQLPGRVRCAPYPSSSGRTAQRITWQIDGAAVAESSATPVSATDSYLPRADETGKRIRCIARLTNAAGTAIAASPWESIEKPTHALFDTGGDLPDRLLDRLAVGLRRPERNTWRFRLPIDGKLIVEVVRGRSVVAAKRVQLRAHATSSVHLAVPRRGPVRVRATLTPASGEQDLVSRTVLIRRSGRG